MNEILHSHCIDSNILRADDFDNFFEKRREALLLIVEEAMGKNIDRPERGIVLEEYEEDFGPVELRA